MPFSSPGPGAFLWSASVSPQDLPVDIFLRNGITSVPVALVPTTDGIIRMKNPKTIQAELRTVTAHYQNITEVRQFGRGGIVCFSSDQPCVQDLLKCSAFASCPVSAFIPPHLACVKGIVRGVDVNLTPPEVLDLFSPAGAISVYRCGRIVDRTKVPTESVIVTFAGSILPKEIKAWPLIYRVDTLSPRPLQCVKCWRYGHTLRGCRSSPRCRVCGEGHNSSECKSSEVKCCLCNEGHSADDANCSAKARELQILEIVEQKRCSRKDAINEIQSRSQGYAGAASRHATSMEASLSLTIADVVERAMEKAMERLAGTLCESLIQIFSNQMAQIFGTSAPITLTPQNNERSQLSEEATSPVSSQDAQSADHVASANQIQNDGNIDEVQESDDMELDPRSLKRTRSPLSKKAPLAIPFKSKKQLKDNLSKSNFLKESILSKAVAEAILAKP